MSRRGLLTWIAAAALAAGADAHPSHNWPERPPLSADDLRRIEALADRGIAAQQRVHGASVPWFTEELNKLGLCPRVEQLLRGSGATGPGLLHLIQPAAAFPDRACAGRLIAFAEAAAAARPEAADTARMLYLAGALWRRIGEEGKGQAAIGRAERLYAALEAGPDWGWSCHGGECLNPAWSTRLAALDIYHGTPLYQVELRWLVFRALSLHAARDARPGEAYIGYTVFEELARSAAEEGEAALGQLAAEETTYGHETYVGHRVRVLLAEGRTAEALALLPSTRSGLGGGIGPFELRADPAGFHARRAHFLEWRDGGSPAEPLSWLPLVWLERGDAARAREALATAREHRARGEANQLGWYAAQKGRVAAADALLDGGADPVGRLAARETGLERDFAMIELAGALAAAGRWAEVRRALAAIASGELRRTAHAGLPCRAAAGGDARARTAIRLIGGRLRPAGTPDERIRFRGTQNQAFTCLFRFRLGEAALDYALATEDPETRLGLLAAMPLASGVEGAAALRRRFAEAALARIEAGRLWANDRVPYIAADFERVGDFARVERILARARGETRILVYRELLGSYAKPRT